MDIIENRTYRFKGSFKYAFQKLKKIEGKRYDNISVSEGNSDFYRSNKKDPGSYQITETDNYLEVKFEAHFDQNVLQI
jgi:hypothetical protein